MAALDFPERVKSGVNGPSERTRGARPLIGYAGAGPAFNGSYGTGVRCPWRFGNLNNGGAAGLAYENGNNAPTNANWNGRPRIYVILKASESLLKCVCISMRKQKSVKPETGKPVRMTVGHACGK